MEITARKVKERYVGVWVLNRRFTNTDTNSLLANMGKTLTTGYYRYTDIVGAFI